jgi:hypothetical protein
MTVKGKVTAAARGRGWKGAGRYKDAVGTARKGSTTDVANHGMNRKPEAERLNHSGTNLLLELHLCNLQSAEIGCAGNRVRSCLLFVPTPVVVVDLLTCWLVVVGKMSKHQFGSTRPCLAGSTKKRTRTEVHCLEKRKQVLAREKDRKDSAKSCSWVIWKRQIVPLSKRRPSHEI